MQTRKKSKTGRLAEIYLLILALAISFACYSAVVVNRTGSLPATMGVHLAILSGFTLITHLIVRFLAPYADPVLLPSAIALNGVGLAMIYRLDLFYGSESPFYVGYKQLVFTLAGIVMMATCLYLLRDYRKLRNYTYTSMVVALVLLLSPLLPVIGKTINGARIWINIGFSIQPSELAKICLAVFFAGYLMMNREALSNGGKQIFSLRLPRIRDLGPLVLVWAFSLAILVFEKDLGTSLLIFGLFVAVLYVATNQTAWLLIGIAMFTPAAVIAAQTFSHVRSRTAVWLGPLNPALYDRKFGGSYQLVQGMFGMADGGLIGTGWAQGSPGIIPFANSDFIYSSLAEELGLLGATGILLVYLLFVQRGFQTSLKIHDSFGKLLAVGLSFTIAWQVFVVVGGITRVIPLTGLTMPFIASGGSSLISNWIVLGILIRISNEARKPRQSSGQLVETGELEIILSAQEQRKRAKHSKQLLASKTEHSPAGTAHHPQPSSAIPLQTPRRTP